MSQIHISKTFVKFLKKLRDFCVKTKNTKLMLIKRENYVSLTLSDLSNFFVAKIPFEHINFTGEEFLLSHRGETFEGLMIANVSLFFDILELTDVSGGGTLSIETKVSIRGVPRKYYVFKGGDGVERLMIVPTTQIFDQPWYSSVSRDRGTDGLNVVAKMNIDKAYLAKINKDAKVYKNPSEFNLVIDDEIYVILRDNEGQQSKRRLDRELRQLTSYTTKENGDAYRMYSMSYLQRLESFGFNFDIECIDVKSASVLMLRGYAYYKEKDDTDDIIIELSSKEVDKRKMLNTDLIY